MPIIIWEKYSFSLLCFISFLVHFFSSSTVFFLGMEYCTRISRLFANIRLIVGVVISSIAPSSLQSSTRKLHRHNGNNNTKRQRNAQMCRKHTLTHTKPPHSEDGKCLYVRSFTCLYVRHVCKFLESKWFHTLHTKYTYNIHFVRSHVHVSWRFWLLYFVAMCVCGAHSFFTYHTRSLFRSSFIFFLAHFIFIFLIPIFFWIASFLVFEIGTE